jgi:hypothetical protein
MEDVLAWSDIPKRKGIDFAKKFGNALSGIEPLQFVVNARFMFNSLQNIVSHNLVSNMCTLGAYWQR